MRPIRLSAAALAALAALGLAACLPDPVQSVLPEADLVPPLVLEAEPTGPRVFALRFDGEVEPVAGSFALEPGPEPVTARAEGELLELEAGRDLEPGADYSVAGEARDAAGNVTRFVFSFVGWNGDPATLRIAEAQTAKNSSATKPHRDYLELEVLDGGNLGGIEISWASSVKAYSYRFPGAAVAAGERVVLHLAPEGKAEEKDETGADLAASGGVDATAAGRDFWCAAGGLPDASGAVALRERPGGEVADGLFYADQSKSGGLDSGKLADLVASMGAAWPLAGTAPAWEDALAWKPSTARSLCRVADAGARGAAAWYVGGTGDQTPGSPNAAPE